jgi:hypothetical protein
MRNIVLNIVLQVFNVTKFSCFTLKVDKIYLYVHFMYIERKNPPINILSH